MLFESSKMRLRKMTKEDTKLYNKWRNDLEVMHSTNPSLDVYPMEATKEFVDHVILGSPTAKSYIMVEKGKEIPIGIVSLINIDYKNRNAECIIDIGVKEYWGTRYGSDGLKLLLDSVCCGMNLHRVTVKVFSFNDRAIGLYTKSGFKEKANIRQSLFRNGEWHDIIHMGILQNEYLRNK